MTIGYRSFIILLAQSSNYPDSQNHNITMKSIWMRISGRSDMQHPQEASITEKNTSEYPMNFKLFRNVQFIYELALAELELEAMGVEFKVADNLRNFNCKPQDDLAYLKKRLAYFDKVNGEVTDYSKIVSFNQTRSPNQYLTHWIYPYKGKYHPQMIRALLNVIGAKGGDVILDPFIGSGTTALECQLLGIDCVGFDVSQVCLLVSKVKTESMNVISDIEDMSGSLLEEGQGPNLFSYEEGAPARSGTLNQTISEIQNESVRNFYKIAELIAESDKNRRRRKDFFGSFKKNAEKMILSTQDYKKVVEELSLPLGNVTIGLGDARNLELKDESIDGIITSPPYSIALDYVKNDSHSLSALGYDLDKVKEEFIGVRGTGKKKVEMYNKDMEKSYDEMFRVLKPGKYCVIVIGNATIQGEEVRTVEMTVDHMSKLGFALEKNMDKIIFGLYNVMQKENILIFRK
jgi:DNA modification methylase